MLQVNLTQEVIDALVNLPKEVAGLKKHLDEVLEENRNLKLGLQHFTREEAGKLLRVSKTTMETWAAKGYLVPVSISGKRLYSAEAIRNFSRENNVALTENENNWEPGKIRRLKHTNQEKDLAA